MFSTFSLLTDLFFFVLSLTQIDYIYVVSRTREIEIIIPGDKLPEKLTLSSLAQLYFFSCAYLEVDRRYN
jgi:hypothetical protein